MDDTMQAFAIGTGFKESQTPQENRNLAIQYYLTMVLFYAEEMKKISQSIAFQVFEVPADARHSVVLLPTQIINLNKSDKDTEWIVDCRVFTNIQEITKAMVANLSVCEALLLITKRFAKKQGMRYTSRIDTKSSNEHTVRITFSRMVNYDKIGT